MANFMIRFLICNIYINAIIGILLTAKHLFKNSLSSRMQYNLWFLLLGLLVVPFIPFRLIGFTQILLWLNGLKSNAPSNTEIIIGDAANQNSAGTTNWMNDFTVSVSSKTPSAIGLILCGIWFAGILAMIILVIKSSLRLREIRQSALPLQNLKVRRLYDSCLNEMKIAKNIPIFSTAFLKSPIIVGCFNPCIYLPIHLILDYKESDIRYMLLHELQHYRYKDALVNLFMNLAGVFYWFNPLIWHALKEMRNDREVACDTSVLKMLDEGSYEDYGNTLINFAEKVSLTPFPFAARLGGNMKQMKRRIANIVSYENPTIYKRLKGIAAFILTAALLLGLAPILSTYAADESRYHWNKTNENVAFVDLSTYFEGYEGCFVLYDMENDAWSIHNMDRATMRVAPDSTYKIYSALFGLEEGVITPENSLMIWNNEAYPFEAWEADHTLNSAMSNTVNWYFQRIDEQLDISTLASYYQKIKYGNENLSGDLASYWMESSLKISPIEQIELLTSIYHNRFGFAPENIQAVKDAIFLSSSTNSTIYGKTGTGRVNGKDINGWFIGYIETADHTYFFATNIRADEGDANGSRATEITMSILSDMNIVSRSF